MGYNGMPQGCDDDDMPWGRDGAALDSKYIFVCHAELNAILNYRGNNNLKGAKVYVTLFPCNESTIASKQMFDMVEIKYRKYEPAGRDIVLSI